MSETVYVNNPPLPFGEHTAVIALNGWKVVNAPRPIPGDVTWEGEFRHGTFYAAGPESFYAVQWLNLDAWPVGAITNLQVIQRVEAMCVERGEKPSEILDSFDGNWSELAAACGLPWNGDSYSFSPVVSLEEFREVLGLAGLDAAEARE